MTSMHGTFVWYELMTTDMEAAEDFYRGVVGWGARDAGMLDFPYTLFTVGEVPVGGLMTLPDSARQAGARPGWIGYVAVEDVDASTAKAQEAGGTLHYGPEDIPGVGRFAMLGDPQGAVITVFRGIGEEPAVTPGTPGRTGWHELYARDWPAAFDFYAALFGWVKADALDMGPMGTYQLLAREGQGEPFGAMMNKPDAVPVPFWNYYFTVEAIDAAVERVAAGGGQVIFGPQEVPGGSWIIQGLDPQGAMFSLVAPRR